MTWKIDNWKKKRFISNESLISHEEKHNLNKL